MSDYIASRRINAPGQYVTAYQPGDGVSADVVSAWELSVPDDVQPAEGYQAPRPAETSTDRAAWEAYVTGQGTDLTEARLASLDALRGLYAAPEPEPTPAWQVNDGVAPVPAVQPPADPQPDPAQVVPERPAASAPKADWVVWAVDAGADRQWASDDATTKANLMAYGQDA